jgi:hypothetical protein
MDRAQPAVQAQLGQEHLPGQGRGWDRFIGGEHGDREGQVEAVPLWSGLGWLCHRPVRSSADKITICGWSTSEAPPLTAEICGSGGESVQVGALWPSQGRLL